MAAILILIDVFLLKFLPWASARHAFAFLSLSSTPICSKPMRMESSKLALSSSSSDLLTTLPFSSKFELSSSQSSASAHQSVVFNTLASTAEVVVAVDADGSKC